MFTAIEVVPRDLRTGSGLDLLPLP